MTRDTEESVRAKVLILREWDVNDPAMEQAHIDDPYGKAGVSFAERWANLMEERMADGATVAEVAKQASHDADTEGITGFMYGCAVSILSQVWEHGEELRKWHNIDTQIGKEGEKANESGGVLNPAILNIG